jgi:acyl carrier protein
VAAAAIEPRIRTLVADRLGVEPTDLAPTVSLVEDLAADSLDLVEVALAVETELDVVLPDRVLERVRTYGDLVVACAERLAARGAGASIDRPVAPLPVHARVHGERGVIEHTGTLTPYGAQAIADDARHAGRNARLDVTVPAEATDATVAAVHDRFAALTGHTVDVHVARMRTPKRRRAMPSERRPDDPRTDATA